MNILRLQRFGAKMLLGIAYLSLVMEWLWVLVIALPPLIESEAFDVLYPQPSQTAPITNSPTVESPLIWGLVGAITLIILGLTVFVLIRLPRTLVDKSEQIVQHTVEVALPIVTHHKQIPANQRSVLSRRLALVLQLSVSVVPVLACLFIPPIKELTFEIIMTVALLLGATSLVAFTLSYAVTPTKTTSRIRSRVSRE